MGAGAVGTYYGALLGRVGHDLTLVTRGDHLAEMRRSGTAIVREADGSRWSVPARALEVPEGPAPDLAIVTTKSHHTRAAAEALAPVLGPGTPVLSLQNGVENVGWLARVLGAHRVLGGIAFVGLAVDEPGVVDHEAEGWVRIGDPAGATELARRVFDLLAPAWDVALSEGIVHDQWHKLLWNAGFNAICAITGATAGEALATPASEALVREAMWEVVAVAARHGVTLGPDDIEGMAAPNASLRDYHPSTARDLHAGRRLERDALCGFLAREGAVQGVPVPVNRVLDGLLALQEDRRAARGERFHLHP